jgi:Protein of unknown function (DUF3352)
MSDPYNPQDQPGQPSGGPEGGVGGPQYGVPPQSAHQAVPPQGVPPQYGVPPQGPPPQAGAPPTMPYGAPQQPWAYDAQQPQNAGYGNEPTAAYPGAGQPYPPGPGYQGEPQFATQQFPTQQFPGQPHPDQPGQPYAGQPYPGQPGQPYPGQPYPGQPGQPYPGQPGQPYPGQGWQGPDVLQGATPGRRGRRWMAVTAAVSVVAVLGVAGGAYAVFGRGNSSPGPDHYVPDSAFTMLTVDLDPPAGQTVAALRFARSFPQLAKNSKGDNLVDGIIRSALTGSDLEDFDKDVRPWLGNTVGLAALPGDGEPHPLVVVKVTDKAKAKSGLDHLAEDTDDIGYTFVDDYVLISDSTDAAEKAATDAKAHPLDGNEQYKHDMDALDDEWVAAGWLDIKGLADALPDELRTAALGNAKGRLALELRFGDKHGELVAKTFDMQQQVSQQAIGEDVGKLPGDTAVAVGVSGLDQSLKQAFDAMRQSGLSLPLDELESQTGLSLPDDIAGLLGSKTVLAAKGDLSGVGLITTADKETAQQTVDKLLSALGEGAPDLVVQEAGDRTILATSEEYAGALAGGGDLGKQEAYRTAVPDAAGASAVLYADLQQVFEATGQEPPEEAKAIRAVGMTVTVDGSDATVRVRVVVR